MIWISVDPGVQNCGLCVWLDKELLEAFLWKSENPFPWEIKYSGTWGSVPGAVKLAVVEQMKVYPGARFAADLLDVSFAAGRVTAEIPEVVKVLPSAWKGQVPKKIHHARLAKNAKPEELAKIEAACIPSLRHNVMDAYGIGKWYIAGGKV